MPVFPDTWVADTHPDLTLEEQGAYWLLICFAWLRPNCDLPVDDKWIAARLGIDTRTWKRLRPRVLEQFWTLADDGDGVTWRQKKQRSVREVVAKSSIANRQAALSRWSKSDAKSNKNNEITSKTAYANGHATAMPPILSNPNNTSRLPVSPGSVGRSLEALPPSPGHQFPFAPSSQPPEQPKPKGVLVKEGTEAYSAWWKHMGTWPKINALGGWYFDSEYPPNYVPQEQTTATKNADTLKQLSQIVVKQMEEDEIPF
jgi:uncharacterized protein YdaU (DUF1376 family)